MLSRICDACKEIILEDTVIHLSREIFKINLDDNQEAEVICGDYCKICLKNGAAVEDLLNAIWHNH